MMKKTQDKLAKLEGRAGDELAMKEAREKESRERLKVKKPDVDLDRKPQPKTAPPPAKAQTTGTMVADEGIKEAAASIETPQYFQIPYDFIDNGAGDLMIVFDAPPGTSRDAKLLYDGFSEAMLIRNEGQVVHLPFLTTPVRDMLTTIKKILVSEMDSSDEVTDVYEAPVEVLNDALPIPAFVYEKFFTEPN